MENSLKGFIFLELVSVSSTLDFDNEMIMRFFHLTHCYYERYEESTRFSRSTTLLGMTWGTIRLTQANTLRNILSSQRLRLFYAILPHPRHVQSIFDKNLSCKNGKIEEDLSGISDKMGAFLIALNHISVREDLIHDTYNG
ncbi:MAG: hypothetical protein JXB10_11695 [Pirellulales bacterium]|nr:hypothetical protein [Pirellulales bacterium]